MSRARFVSAASVATMLSCAVAALAAQAPQTTQQPPTLKPVLAGKKLTPPVRGEAQVEFTSTKPARIKDNVVTKFTIKNLATAPIARFTVDETWYDKSGSVITGGRGVVSGLLQPGEIQIVTIETPWKAGMLSNNYRFSHANGTIKPHKVAKLDAPTATAKATDKEPATKQATTKK